MVEPGPPTGHPIPALPGPPPVHPAIAPPPPLPVHPDRQEQEEHLAIENVLVPEDITPQTRPSPVSTMLPLHDDICSHLHQQPVVYFSPEQLDGLKRKFDDMMGAASGPVPPELAHALGSVFDHIERTATDIDIGRISKRPRI